PGRLLRTAPAVRTAPILSKEQRPAACGAVGPRVCVVDMSGDVRCPCGHLEGNPQKLVSFRASGVPMGQPRVCFGSQALCSQRVAITRLDAEESGKGAASQESVANPDLMSHSATAEWSNGSTRGTPGSRAHAAPVNSACITAPRLS